MNGSGAAGKIKRYILVVDDNVDDRFGISMVLQQFDYAVCTANSAGEALEFMLVAPPAAIVSEGGPIGTTLISRLKKDPRLSDVPVVFVAGSPSADLEARTRRGEFAAFLKKPLNVEEFYRVIQAAMEKTPRRNIRFAVFLKATIENVGEGGEGYVTVLSESGMFYKTLDPQARNARLTVNLEINDRRMQVEASVVSSYSFEESPFKEPGMGMKFVKIGPDDQAYIKAFIHEQLEKGMPKRNDPSPS